MFSMRENSVIERLGDEKLTIKDISYSLFGADADTPLNAENLVSNNINRINKKCKFYNLPWLLKKEKVGKKMYIHKIQVKVAHE